MKIYNYKCIRKVDANGIDLIDGSRIDFFECKTNFARNCGLGVDETDCVAERNSTGNIPYFIFFTNEETRIDFVHKVLFFRIKKKHAFLDLQVSLNQLGYRLYDCS